MDWLLWELPVIDIPAVLLAGVIGVWLLVRNRATIVDSKTGLDDLIGRGEPVVLEFFGKL